MRETVSHCPRRGRFFGMNLGLRLGLPDLRRPDLLGPLRQAPGLLIPLLIVLTIGAAAAAVPVAGAALSEMTVSSGTTPPVAALSGTGLLTLAAIHAAMPDQPDSEIPADLLSRPGEMFGIGGPTYGPPAAPESPPALEVRTHKVVQGDTLYGLAGQYNIPVETLIAANNLELSPEKLTLGQELIVLPVPGVIHVVKAGDTVDGIARRYGVDMAAVMDFPWNKLEGPSPLLQIGQKLIVPGGVKPRAPVATPKPAAPPAAVPAQPAAPAAAPAQPATPPAEAPAGGDNLTWPTAGAVGQGFRGGHAAIDIGANQGTPVVAAAAGTVITAGWSAYGYGNHVVIDHGNGLRTLYAHLSRIDVKAGQAVGQGAQIGAVGSTGNSSGPHLHFEVIQGGVRKNPRQWLK